jgi:glyoxylase-like metal-dependent hydrolase (beta-lactamase superfamily II)
MSLIESFLHVKNGDIVPNGSQTKKPNERRMIMSGYGMPDVKTKQRPVLPDWQGYPYSVLPVPVIKSEGISKGLFTYLLDYEKPMTVNGGFFFINGLQGHNILVDTGPTVEDFAAHGYPCEGIKPMPEALRDAVGLTPADIDTVIFTHLHHDHCPLAKLFKHAKLIIQEDEWHAVHHSPACYRPLYNPEYVEGLNPTLVDGDVFNVFPGIHLLYTPGHTPGGQSVVIDTKDGRVIICGFCCDESNLNPPAELKAFWPEVLIPGLHVNSEDAYESAMRVKKEADYIITLHDPKTFERGVCPSPKWPKYESM